MLNDIQIIQINGEIEIDGGKKSFPDTKGRFFHQNLFNVGIVKECGRCHKRKPYKEFGEKIIGSKYKEQIKGFYKNIEKNVLKFKFRTSEIKDPLN